MRILCTNRVLAVVSVIASFAVPLSAQVSNRAGGYMPLETMRAERMAIPAPLARTVSVEHDQVLLQQALLEISTQAGLGLTYGSDLTRDHVIVSVDAMNVPAAEALLRAVKGTQWQVWVTRAGLVTVSRREKQPDGMVKGHVTDQTTGRAIAGVAVRISGTELGGMTDADGAYEITRIPPGPQTVVARRLGYLPVTQSVTVPPTGTVTLDFAMTVSPTDLSAIVVTGTAGAQERITQPAVIASVDADQIARTAPISNVTDLLNGRVSGVVMTASGGSSGAGSKINIRGATSISLSNAPLVFIDGVRVESNQRGLANVGGVNFTEGTTLDPLNEINPADIASIEVVKGPAAATLYGSDASAGVIQIITKKGKAGDQHMTQNLSLEYNGISPGFNPYTNYAVCPTGGPASPFFLCQDVAAGDVIMDNPLERQGGFQNGHTGVFNYSVRGGGSTYGYYVSTSATNEQGTTASNTLQRRTGRLNLNWVANSGLQFDANVGLSRDNVNLPQEDQSANGYLFAGIIGNPLAVTQLPDGTLTGGMYLPNQSVTSIQQVRADITTIRSTPSVQVHYTPFAWLSNRLTLGADINRSSGRTLYPKNEHGWYDALGPAYANGRVQENLANPDTYTVDYLGTLSSRFGANQSITSDFSFGTQFINRTNNGSLLTGQGLTTNSTTLIGTNPATSVSQVYTQTKQFGFFGQEQLGFADRLFVQLGMRGDRFSSFGADVGTFLLPKIGASYVMSQESFWRGLSGVIPTLRLRAAYGTTGRAPLAGASLTTYMAGPYVTTAGVEGAGLYPLNSGNANLKPEKGTEFEGGLDATFFHDRMGLELTYFDKVSTNVLVQVPPAPSLGFPLAGGNIYRNLGKVTNRGIEFTLRGTPLETRNVTWEASINGSTLRNRIESLGGASPFNGFDPNRKFAPGYTIGSYFTRKILSVDPATQHVVVTDTGVYFGDQIPKFQGNFRTSLTFFRNLRVSALFTAKQGYKVYNLTQQYRDIFGISSEVVLHQAGLQGGYTDSEYAQRFGDATGQVYTESGTPIGALGVIAAPYIQSGNYVRFQELSATLTLPDALARSIRAGSAAITIGGRNLHLWSDYGGYDPEILGIGVGAPGDPVFSQFGNADVFSTPQPRRWIARLNLTF